MRRWDVFLAGLDPTVGSEIQKARPCVVVSPDEMNRHLRTLIIAPMTTMQRAYPSRVPIRFQGKAGDVALDQIRAIDRRRLAKRLGSLSDAEADAVRAVLLEMFA